MKPPDKGHSREKGLSQLTVPGRRPLQQRMQDVHAQQLLASIHSQEQRETNARLSCLTQSRTPKSGSGACGFSLGLPTLRQSPTDVPTGQLDLEPSF